MSGALRSVIAGAAGVAVALVTVTIGEAIGHAVYPLPAGMDFSNPAAVRELVASMPLGAFLFVLGSWIAATIAGGAVAGAIARPKAMRLALVVGGVIHAAVDPAEAKIWSDYLSLITRIFLRLITMLIAPLVFSTLTSGIAKLDIMAVGRIGARSIIWFAVASLFSLLLGMVMAMVLAPTSPR